MLVKITRYVKTCNLRGCIAYSYELIHTHLKCTVMNVMNDKQLN